MTDLLAVGLMDAHPKDAAQALGDLPPGALAAFLQNIPDKTVAQVLTFFPALKAAQCIEALPLGKTRTLVPLLPAATAIPMLQVMQRATYKQVMAELPITALTALRLVQRFPEGSVGSVMDPYAFTLKLGTRVDEALKLIRKEPENLDHVAFVVDEQHRLQGLVALRDLILAGRKAKIDSLVQPDPPVFSPLTRLREIETHRVWNRETQVAVTDRKGGFLGALRQERMVMAIDSLATTPPQDGIGNTFVDFADLLWSALYSLIAPWVEKDSSSREQLKGRK